MNFLIKNDKIKNKNNEIEIMGKIEAYWILFFGFNILSIYYGEAFSILHLVFHFVLFILYFYIRDISFVFTIFFRSFHEWQFDTLDIFLNTNNS